MYRELWLRHLLTFTVLTLGVIGFGFSSNAAEPKAKATAQKQLPAKQNFVACHPPEGDLSPDGKFFVTVNQAQPVLNLLEIGPEQKQSQIQLPKKAHDVVFIDNTIVVVSFGPWGELAVVDLKEPRVEKPVKVAASADGMCRVADGRVVIVDSKSNSIHLVDPNTSKVLKTIPVQSKPVQMRWTVPDLQMEVADAQGKILSNIELPR